MKNRGNRKHNEMTCPECGQPMNEEAELKVKVRWHDAVTDPPKDEGIFKLVILNGKCDNVNFEGAMAIGAYYQARGKHPSEWDIESNIRDLPSRLVTHWAELPEGPKEREGDATKG